MSSKVLGRVFGWREGGRAQGSEFLGVWPRPLAGGVSAERCGGWTGVGLSSASEEQERKGLAPLSLSGWVKNRKRQQPCRTWKAFARAGGNWTEGGGGGRHGREGATSTLGAANAGHMMYPSTPLSSLLHQSLEACTVVPPV